MPILFLVGARNQNLSLARPQFGSFALFRYRRTESDSSESRAAQDSTGGAICSCRMSTVVETSLNHERILSVSVSCVPNLVLFCDNELW